LTLIDFVLSSFARRKYERSAPPGAKRPTNVGP
jgi:hypothetical protein